MKILVEGYHYPSGPAWNLLDNFNIEEFKNGKKKTTDVGYCFDKVVGDCIFVLPKVILDENDKLFGKYTPEQVCDPETFKSLTNDEYRFLHELSVWVYRSLREYKKEFSKSDSIKEKVFSEIGKGHEVQGSMLDAILALRKFYRENKGFVLFTLKKAHSQKHKILWQKTIAKTTAIMQDGVPIYLNPISKKKEIDWDEELMRIYFSILNYTNKFGPKIQLDVNCDLIKGALFDAYMKGMGVRKLQQIKYKYYSDKTIKLWTLCYNFFKKGEQIRSSKQSSEILVATKYDRVFEAIMDKLIGDPGYDEWKKIGDGKIIDHIYSYKSVCSPDETFYIGDSKYYPVKSGVESGTIAAEKQFTYARQVVCNSIRDKMQKSKDKMEAWPYRDPLSEGYAIIPNFFIGAKCDSELRFDYDGLDDSAPVGKPILIRQFINRLFDRDTLWVRQYNLNYLHIVSLYGSADISAQHKFRDKAHMYFRGKTIETLDNAYEFYLLTPKDNQKLEDVMSNEVKWALRGMTFRTAKDSNTLLLAIEKQHSKDDVDDDVNYEGDVYMLEDKKRIAECLDKFFTKEPIKLLDVS